MFKWIKQHLRIKAFYGTSENAVKTQIWIAVSVYVLVAIVRKRLGLEASLYQILQILSVTLFEKTPILRALQASDFENDLGDSGNQLILFDLYPDTSEVSTLCDTRPDHSGGVLMRTGRPKQPFNLRPSNKLEIVGRLEHTALHASISRKFPRLKNGSASKAEIQASLASTARCRTASW